MGLLLIEIGTSLAPVPTSKLLHSVPTGVSRPATFSEAPQPLIEVQL